MVGKRSVSREGMPCQMGNCRQRSAPAPSLRDDGGEKPVLGARPDESQGTRDHENVARARHAASPVASRPGTALKGRLRVPGDKSISHRSMIFGLLAIGETRVEGLLEGDDVLRTAEACRALGATITREAPGPLAHRRRRHRRARRSPTDVLDFGNAGHRLAPDDGRGRQPPDHRRPSTATPRCASAPCAASSIRSSRWASRVVSEAEGGRVPLTLRGPRETIPITYETPAASAQIKSAVLLAGLNSPGTHHRDRARGDPRPHGADAAPFRGRASRSSPTARTAAPSPCRASRSCAAPTIVVPTDPSSAAFPLVAALITPGSDVVIEGVMMNPLRTGLITTLLEMGADIERLNERDEGGETVADLRVRTSRLTGVTVPACPRPCDDRRIPDPRGRGRLRRGHDADAGPARAARQGIRPPRRRRGGSRGGRRARTRSRATTSSSMARRQGPRAAARSRPISTTASPWRSWSWAWRPREPMTVDDGAMIATSFPTFIPLMRELGATIQD